MENHLDILRKIPLFNNLTEQELRDISALFQTCRCQAGDYLIRAADVGDALYILIEGRALVQLTGRYGQNVVLNHIEPGHYVGEIALLDGRPRSADIECTAPSLFLKLNRDDFNRVLLKHPALMQRLLINLCSRLRHAEDMILGIGTPEQLVC